MVQHNPAEGRLISLVAKQINKLLDKRGVLAASLVGHLALNWHCLFWFAVCLLFVGTKLS